jgi:hypothetical protein
MRAVVVSLLAMAMVGQPDTLGRSVSAWVSFFDGVVTLAAILRMS